MKGTEKQVKWATDLIDITVRTGEEFKLKAPQYAKSIDYHIACMKAVEHAGLLISAQQSDNNDLYVCRSELDWKSVLIYMRDNNQLVD